MTQFILPTLFATFLWWFSTGAIFFLDGLPKRTFKWSLLGAGAVTIAAFYFLHKSAQDVSAHGAYVAFTCGLLIWGWQEISFYMGFLTGPRRHECEEGCRGWRHFGHALLVSLHHELSILVCGAIVLALTWGAPNQLGLWTYLTLFFMHQSARLNVFLGVRNLNAEFLPPHLTYLRSFMKQAPINLLFPISVTAGTAVLAWFVQRAAAADPSSFEATAFIFLSALLALAVLEHWVLILPIPFQKLWSWSLKSRRITRLSPTEGLVATLAVVKSFSIKRM
ncbi:MAG: putative photosynthetic complex assembly protein PuhE [Elsteraceae bacterium]